MKKKLILMMALLCCLVLVVGILAACNGDEGTQPGGRPSGNSSAYAGRYYEQVNGNLNADSWIELDDDWSWTDSDTMMGTFTVKGSNIYFYWMTTSEPMFGGTISNGELTIELYGTYYTYKQGTPSVDKPEDPDKEDPDDEKPEEPEEPEEEYFTVTFNVNGGDSAISSREYLAGALMSLPTPTRDGYRFLGWYDAMGWRYDNTSVMPDNDLTLTARWEIVVSSYEDEYVYFKPATEGKKQPNNFYYPYQEGATIHHYIYVELESDNIGGPNAVGDKNNLDLASRVDMEFSVEDGYTLTWYNDSSFTSINGAQMFTLGYGSNIYFLTVSEGARVVQRYLIDFYIKHDYYINLYHDIYAAIPYDKERVVEGELLPDDIRQSVTSGLEFDKWVYRNVEASEYVEFDFSTPIREDWSLYQTFKPKKITADLDGGTLNEDIYVTPYEAGHKLPVPTKEGYDFIGWQLPGYDDVMRAYFADRYGNNVSKMLGSGGGAMDDVYFDTLKAVWLPKQFAMQERGDAVSFEATQADITYADDEHVNIESIQYLLSGSSAYIPADKLYGYGEEVTLTAAKTGYTFLGWYYGEEKVTDALTYEFIMPAENVTYTAKWVFYTVSLEKTEGGSVGLNAIDRDSADISFDLNGAGGIAPVTQTVTSEVGLVYPEIPAYRGHVFAGWYDNSGCEGSPFDFSVPVTRDVTLYAKWISYSGSGVIPYNGSLTVDVVSKSSSTKHYYAFVPLVSGNISVYSNGGMSDTYGTLYDSNKRQLTYDDDSGDGNNFKITYSVTAGRLYYIVPAGYNSSGTTTVYLSGDMPDAGGTYGSLLPADDEGEPIKITVGERVELTATTQSGYTFIGWYNGEEKVTDALTYEFTMSAENVTYTAKWIKVAVESEDTTKGTVSQLTETYFPGDTASVTATTKSGCTFIGWYNGDEKLTDSLTYEFTMPAENVTYTAKWIKVAVESEDTTKGTVSELTETFLPGDEVSVAATTNPGYTFIGWYNGDEKLTDTLTYEFTMPAENVTYTAKWIKVAIVSEDTSKGTVSQLTGTYFPGDDVNVTATTKSGYTFIGWYNGDENVADGLTYEFTMPAEDVTYTAKWIKVTLDKNIINAGNISELTDSYLVGDTVTVNASTNDGYTWIGWYNGDIKITNEQQLTFNMPSVATHYTACWEANKYVITLDACGGVLDVSSEINIKYGEMKKLAVPTKADYYFGGWFTSDNVQISEKDGTMISSWGMANDAVLFAKWLRKISFDAKGGESVAPIYIEPGTPVMSLPSTTKTGYTLETWLKDGNPVDANYVMPDENIILNANWRANQYKIFYGDNNEYIYVTYGEKYSIPMPVKTGYIFDYFYENGDYRRRFSASGYYERAYNTVLDCKWLKDLSRTVSKATTINESPTYLADGMTFTITYDGQLINSFVIETNYAVNIKIDPSGPSYTNVKRKAIRVSGGTKKVSITITIIKAPVDENFTLKFTCE